MASAADSLTLDITPRVCTLSAGDKACSARVKVSWRAPQPVSICLGIANRPEPPHCWEGVAQGSYALELSIEQDVTFEIRDHDLRAVLVSAVLRVVRETHRYRYKRREPWNVFD